MDRDFILKSEGLNYKSACHSVEAEEQNCVGARVQACVTCMSHH